MNELLIINLPFDLIESIQYKLGINSWRSLVLDQTINKKKSKVIALLKIQLFLKIFIYYKILYNYISKNLKRIFGLPFNGTYSLIRIPQSSNQILDNSNDFLFYKEKINKIGCVYYAPHVPNGNCRICGNCKNKHYLSCDLIENHYLSIFL